MIFSIAPAPFPPAVPLPQEIAGGDEFTGEQNGDISCLETNDKEILDNVGWFQTPKLTAIVLTSAPLQSR